MGSVGTSDSIPSTRIINIAGPTGAGKTTLAHALSAISVDITVVSEPGLHSIRRWTDSNSWHDTQLAIVRHRASQLARARTPLAIMDRHFSEDREVFFRMHRKLRHLTLRQYHKLVSETADVEADFPLPYRIIYVIAPRNVLLARMHLQGQPEWLTTNLELQLRLYDEWLESRTSATLVIDTTRQHPQVLAQCAWEWIHSP